MKPAFDGERFRALARGLTLGHPLVATLETGSTNDDALRAARAGAPHGALFVTEHQRAGRGRRGNTWLAAPGEGLLFSCVLRPKVAAESAPALALLAGLAVREAAAAELAAAGAPVEVLVKWPNDVVVGRRKLAGILVESQIRGSEVGAVVVGVGLNTGRLEHLPELATTATSLGELGATVTREALLAAILRGTEARLALLESPEMPMKSLVAELVTWDALKGHEVTVGALRGVASGIDAMGKLAIADANGVTHRIASGHVSLWDDRE